MVSTYEENYDEINAELRRMAQIAADEQEPSPEVAKPKIFIGSGEDVFLFHWKDIEHHAN